MRHILVATDASDHADRAIAVAIELAKALESKLSILTVMTQENLSAEEIRILTRSEGSLPDALENLSKDLLRSAGEKAASAGLKDVRTFSLWGDPAKVITETARQAKADAIVVGRRGRDQLSGLIFGSVSQKVLSLASCIVIVVP